MTSSMLKTVLRSLIAISHLTIYYQELMVLETTTSSEYSNTAGFINSWEPAIHPDTSSTNLGSTFTRCFIRCGFGKQIIILKNLAWINRHFFRVMFAREGRLSVYSMCYFRQIHLLNKIHSSGSVVGQRAWCGGYNVQIDVDRVLQLLLR